MDFRPIEAVGAVHQVSLKGPSEDVAPPFAIDDTGRMQEDSYSAAADQQERGLEEEDLEQAGEEEETPSESTLPEPPKQVNFFA